MRTLICVLLAVCFLTACDELANMRPVGRTVDYPLVSGYVTDEAKVLTDNGKHRLYTLIKNEKESFNGNEIAVVTVQTLHGVDVATYANGLARKIGVGQKGKDNGVLVLLALKERKVRLEVGYGLESVIPDAIAKRIVQESVPYLKKGNYDEGLIHIVNSVISQFHAKGK